MKAKKMLAVSVKLQYPGRTHLTDALKEGLRKVEEEGLVCTSVVQWFDTKTDNGYIEFICPHNPENPEYIEVEV